MNLFNRRAAFRGWNADTAHQCMAGLASWAAFSARWRARQGLPLLHPLDVQYLTPQDFCNGLRHPLPEAAQRRLFREYVAAACATAATGAIGRRGGLVGADLMLIRSQGFVRRWGRSSQDFEYGRADVGRYETMALSPVRPYGVPVAAKGYLSYWLDGARMAEEEDNGDESWIE
jgi:hypothetical protein